jgi:predicted GTPase
MSNVLDESLAKRQSHIKTAKDYLAKTKVLFDEFGSAELKTSHAKFEELLDALNADQVRLVVIGEFSRGKSSLVNALLGIELLPTAMEATTAINTFIRALPAGKHDRFIRIHYQDNKPCEDMPWRDDSELVRWGTELDEHHAHVRRSLDYIEVFMDHDLLKKGLVLIDTPGLESVMKHHEGITRKAIAEAALVHLSYDY